MGVRTEINDWITEIIDESDEIAHSDFTDDPLEQLTTMCGCTLPHFRNDVKRSFRESVQNLLLWH